MVALFILSLNSRADRQVASRLLAHVSLRQRGKVQQVNSGEKPFLGPFWPVPAASTHLPLGTQPHSAVTGTIPLFCGDENDKRSFQKGIFFPPRCA